MTPQRFRGLYPAGRFAGYLLQAAVVLAAVALLATCAASPSVLGRIQRTDTLVLATPNSPTTYYLGAYGATGPAWDLASQLAHELGVRLVVRSVANGDAALAEVAAGRADIAAPGISVNPADYPQLRFAPPYQALSSLLVYRVGAVVPDTEDDLASPDFNITVAPGFAPLMRQIAVAHPGIAWQVSADRDSDELLVAVAQGDIPYTVVNQNEFNLNRRFYPRLRVAFTLGAPQPLAWAIRKHADPSLYQATVAFFARAKAGQTVANLLKRYYSTGIAYDRVGTRLFLDDVGNRLQIYAASFQRAAAATGLSWQLLAAVGYQESHWDPQAVSPTGVRGLMMLTVPTAHSLGIHDRTDPHLSIIGAARYLALLLNELPITIAQPDRSWMALAAYNVGIAHVLDARRLTARQGGDPNSWNDVKQRLALLAEYRFYRHARYGYANGVGAVHYVANIRGYYDILSWRMAQNTLPPQVADSLAAAPVVPAYATNNQVTPIQ